MNVRQRMTGPSTALVLAWCLAATGAQAQSCRVASGAAQNTLVELYTSEGCDSCPAADRWLSGLRTGAQKGQAELWAAAFHVDYWDRLGWKDRFADTRFTQRQSAQTKRSGARFNYTPQVLVNGRDARAGALPAASTDPAKVSLALTREANGSVAVQVQRLAGAPLRLGLWWAVLEDGHVSEVKAGENRGVTLKHDHVVRSYGEWPAADATAGLAGSLALPLQGEGGRQPRLLVVVTDGTTGAPLQVLQAPTSAKC